ncbi:unnamed protein product [Gordionus sp. m RMFG-2023]
MLTNYSEPQKLPDLMDNSQKKICPSFTLNGMSLIALIIIIAIIVVTLSPIMLCKSNLLRCYRAANATKTESSFNTTAQLAALKSEGLITYQRMHITNITRQIWEDELLIPRKYTNITDLKRDIEYHRISNTSHYKEYDLNASSLIDATNEKRLKKSIEGDLMRMDLKPLNSIQRMESLIRYHVPSPMKLNEVIERSAVIIKAKVVKVKGKLSKQSLLEPLSHSVINANDDIDNRIRYDIDYYKEEEDIYLDIIIRLLEVYKGYLDISRIVSIPENTNQDKIYTTLRVKTRSKRIEKLINSDDAVLSHQPIVSYRCDSVSLKEDQTYLFFLNIEGRMLIAECVDRLGSYLFFSRELENLIMEKLNIDHWSDWGPCGSKCGGGTQDRKRKCHSTPKECHKEIELRKCNLFKCEGMKDMLEGVMLKHFPRGVKKLKFRPTSFQISRYATLMTPTTNIFREGTSAKSMNLFMSFKAHPGNDGYLFTISSLKAKIQFGIKLGKETIVFYKSDHRDIKFNSMVRTKKSGSLIFNKNRNSTLKANTRKRYKIFPFFNLTNTSSAKPPLVISNTTPEYNVYRLFNYKHSSLPYDVVNASKIRDSKLFTTKNTENLSKSVPRFRFVRSLYDRLKRSLTEINQQISSSREQLQKDQESSPFLSNEVIYIRPDPVWLPPLNDGHWHSLAVYLNKTHTRIHVDCREYGTYKINEGEDDAAIFDLKGVTTLGSNFENFPSLKERFEGFFEHVFLSTSNNKDISDEQCHPPHYKAKYQTITNNHIDEKEKPKPTLNLTHLGGISKTNKYGGSSKTMTVPEPLQATKSVMSATDFAHSTIKTTNKNEQERWIISNSDDEDYPYGSGFKGLEGSGHLDDHPVFSKTDLLTTSPTSNKNCEEPCLNHGICSQRGECHCSWGYQGKNCSEYKCGIKGCLNGGKCIKPNVCSCDKDYFGKLCEYSHCSKSCIDNGGTCTEMGICLCPPGYLPPDCSPLCMSGCHNGGQCVSFNKCVCKDEYYGQSCKKRKCSEESCLNDGICNNATNMGQPLCNCKFGFYGKRCEKKHICTMIPFREKYQKVYILHVEDEALVPCKEWGMRGCYQHPKYNQEQKFMKDNQFHLCIAIII